MIFDDVVALISLVVLIYSFYQNKSSYYIKNCMFVEVNSAGCSSIASFVCIALFSKLTVGLAVCILKLFLVSRSKVNPPGREFVK